jgi:hypothetical protein
MRTDLRRGVKSRQYLIVFCARFSKSKRSNSRSAFLVDFRFKIGARIRLDAIRQNLGHFHPQTKTVSNCTDFPRQDSYNAIA